MKRVSVCPNGGIKISTEGETIECISTPEISTRDNILRSTRFVAELVAGKIDNKSEEVHLVEFIDLAVEALNILATRLKELRN